MIDKQPIFRTGGALAPDYARYIEREVDRAAMHALETDKHIYLIAPRQMGKTSLLKRLAAQLKNQGWISVVIDLAALKSLSRTKWFRAVGQRIAQASGIALVRPEFDDQEDFRGFLFEDIGLSKTAARVRLALFFDEIEGLLGLEFSDGFLMTLRNLYQDRFDYPGQLFIAYAGCISPTTLIHDDNISPFNVAERIDLDDFSEVESLELTSCLSLLGTPVEETAHAHIFSWTGGQPHLTQRVCEILETRATGGHIQRITPTEIDHVVIDHIIAPHVPNRRDSNLAHVVDEIQRLQTYPDQLWKRLLAGQPVHSTAPGFYALYLTGAVKAGPDGRIGIRNRIYEQALVDVPFFSELVGKPQLNDQNRLDEIKRRRLQVLKERQAYFGPNTPAHIVMEINELEAATQQGNSS